MADAPRPSTSISGVEKVNKPPTPMPLPRDPQIAVQEEFDAAKLANTRAAWELFLARHSDNMLANAARQEMNRIPMSSDKSKKN